MNVQYFCFSVPYLYFLVKTSCQKNMEKKRDASVAPLFLPFHLHILFFCLFVVTLSDKIVIIFRQLIGELLSCDSFIRDTIVSLHVLFCYKSCGISPASIWIFLFFWYRQFSIRNWLSSWKVSGDLPESNFWHKVFKSMVCEWPLWNYCLPQATSFCPGLRIPFIFYFNVPSVPDIWILSSGAESIRLCLSVSGLSVSDIE